MRGRVCKRECARESVRIGERESVLENDTQSERERGRLSESKI